MRAHSLKNYSISAAIFASVLWRVEKFVRSEKIGPYAAISLCLRYLSPAYFSNSFLSARILPAPKIVVYDGSSQIFTGICSRL